MEAMTLTNSTQEKDAFEITEEDKEHLEKCAWLRKQGHVVRTWRKRWFVLSGETLSYYAQRKDVTDGKARGMIPLVGSCILEGDVRGHRHSFRILTHENVEYPIECTSIEEKTSWVTALQRSSQAAYEKRKGNV